LFTDVEQSRLHELWQVLREIGLATANIGLLTNIIACPGGDFCSLANAKSLPIAQAIQEAFDDLDFVHDIGELDLNISGCINSCGHHHVGHIGILGVDKNGEEFYQVTLGGHQGGNGTARTATIGRIIGPSFADHEVPGVIERLIGCYLKHRDSEAERFVDTVHRIGIEPFKESAYGRSDRKTAADDRSLALA
jgi:sulfite reductase (NADPH) hemoprotein beta-component